MAISFLKVFPGVIVGHDLIPASQLAKKFNEEDLFVYLKERRDQVRHDLDCGG